MNKTYCMNKDCPFDDCDKHAIQLEGKEGKYTFANLYSVCRRYISWLVDEVKKDG